MYLLETALRPVLGSTVGMINLTLSHATNKGAEHALQTTCSDTFFLRALLTSFSFKQPGTAEIESADAFYVLHFIYIES